MGSLVGGGWLVLSGYFDVEEVTMCRPELFVTIRTEEPSILAVIVKLALLGAVLGLVLGWIEGMMVF